MVTISLMTTLEVREARWNEFLASLKPWELHQLTKDEQELVLHDAFLAGETTLRQIRLDLSFVVDPIFEVGDPRD